MNKTFPTVAVELVRAGYDLTLRQSAVLIRAVETPRDKAREQVTVRSIAAWLGISKPAVSRAMDRLCEHNLAVRLEDEQDRRSVFLLPTQQGLDLATDFMGASLKAKAAR